MQNWEYSVRDCQKRYKIVIIKYEMWNICFEFYSSYFYTIMRTTLTSEFVWIIALSLLLFIVMPPGLQQRHWGHHPPCPEVHSRWSRLWPPSSSQSWGRGGHWTCQTACRRQTQWSLQPHSWRPGKRWRLSLTPADQSRWLENLDKTSLLQMKTMKRMFGPNLSEALNLLALFAKFLGYLEPKILRLVTLQSKAHKNIVKIFDLESCYL